MDKDITGEVWKNTRRKTTLYISISICLLAGAIWLMRSYFKSSVSRKDLLIAVVETGDVENTLNASGEILPEFEEVITSSINGSVKNALLNAGSAVKAGQSILLLDKSASESEYARLKFQLETRRNEIKKLKVDLSKSYFDIRSSNDIKQLRISSLQDAVENAKRLFKAGGGTREGIDEAELNLKVALLEKKQLENEVKSKQQTMLIEQREAEIALKIQENELNEVERKLALANVVATRNGVITFVNRNIGATIHEGDILARIADLRSFKVTGSISDSYLDQVHAGMPAIVRFNETDLRGHISNILPAISNNVVSFDVQLDDRHDKRLRPNMKAEIFLVTAAHAGVTRVTNGAAFKGLDNQDVFIIKGDKAIRQSIRTGLVNFDHLEILSGLQPGDSVIITDMSEYKNSAELAIKKP